MFTNRVDLSTPCRTSHAFRRAGSCWRCPFRSTAARRGTICTRCCGILSLLATAATCRGQEGRKSVGRRLSAELSISWRHCHRGWRHKLCHTLGEPRRRILSRGRGPRVGRRRRDGARRLLLPPGKLPSSILRARSWPSDTPMARVALALRQQSSLSETWIQISGILRCDTAPNGAKKPIVDGKSFGLLASLLNVAPQHPCDVNTIWSEPCSANPSGRRITGDSGRTVARPVGEVSRPWRPTEACTRFARARGRSSSPSNPDVAATKV
jgi:hypothetical protein